MNKRGEVDEAGLLETLVFVILNVIFFVTMLLFVYNVGTRAFVYEESYAKEIALIIDNAKPESAILLNIESAVIFAEEDKMSSEEIIKLGKKDKTIEVRLRKGRGYSYKYFSNYNVDLKVNGNWLTIVIKDNIKNEVKNETGK